MKDMTRRSFLGFLGSAVALCMLPFQWKRQSKPLTLYVNGASGDDRSPGTSPSSPMQSIGAAIERCEDGRGDTIILTGGEQDIGNTLTVDKANLTIRGGVINVRTKDEGGFRVTRPGVWFKDSVYHVGKGATHALEFTKAAEPRSAVIGNWAIDGALYGG